MNGTAKKMNPASKIAALLGLGSLLLVGCGPVDETEVSTGDATENSAPGSDEAAPEALEQQDQALGGCATQYYYCCGRNAICKATSCGYMYVGYCYGCSTPTAPLDTWCRY